ncbi:toll/interleukin-1 receptor domain-containing protein [Nodosilinea sp. E11]|uniref:toll/interleukin-1 receptor domain-containing protein n=1 Tax=Nodosilinea sp. E11 TaxID=3037479 RepID=UPI003977B121
MIFISYSWADSVFARHIARQLSEQGHQVWIDYQNLNLTEPLAPQIASAIRAANLVLVVSSPHTWLSRWVQFELLLAQLWCKSIHVIRVPLEAC